MRLRLAIENEEDLKKEKKNEQKGKVDELIIIYACNFGLNHYCFLFCFFVNFLWDCSFNFFEVYFTYAASCFYLISGKQILKILYIGTYIENREFGESNNCIIIFTDTRAYIMNVHPRYKEKLQVIRLDTQTVR